MADVILSPIVDLIVETLGSAAVQEIKSLWGVRDDLEGLQSTLSAIRSVLVDAEKKQIRDDHVRDWLQKLEDVLNDADDLVDEVNTEGLRRKLMPGKKIRKKVRTFFSSNNQLVFRHKMAREIKNIRARLDAISADKQNFRLEVAQEIQPERNARETGTTVHVENVFGRESEKMEILKRLMSLDAETGSSSTTRRERVFVIPIIGIGGLGKTTLAQLVYNSKEVEKHFSVKLWVCVSDNVDKSPLIEKLAGFITNASTKHLRMPKLEETVRDKIHGKRFLLVLDDVWNREINQEWEKLKDLLEEYCVEGSRVVVTTRDDMVAQSMGGVQPYCHLGKLNPEDSWNLFKKKAFERFQEPTDPTILDIAHRVVKKCSGVPLAIRMIGSMLSYKNPETEWSSFLTKELSNIPKKDHYILPTLKLSYDYLPSHLKPCFAYCSLFQKDYEFDVHTLITLWISQGFIRTDQSQSLEEIGYEYFKDLLWRSFFQEPQKDELLNMVTTCKMHDLVHDLAIQVAGEKYALLASGEENLRKSVRHMSFDVSSTCSFKEIPSSWLQGQRIRSCLFPSIYYEIGDSKLDEAISSLKFLRTLVLCNMMTETVPDSVGKLKHLRYLDLSRNDWIITLPASITKLVNLQTLKLNECYSLRELPSEIEKLVNLKHLELKGCHSITHMPRGLGKLTKLQTLPLVVLSENIPSSTTYNHGKLDELMGLNNLRGELTIKGIRSGMETTVTKLREKKHLRSLYLDFKRRDDDASSSEQEWETTLEGLQPHTNLKELTLSDYGGATLSPFLSLLTNLATLRVHNCSKCRQLPSLDKFHSLKEIELFGLEALEYITITEGDYNFSKSSSPSISVLPSLQKLKLYALPNLRGWWRSDMVENQVDQVVFPSFPCLSSLRIELCPKLTSMPCYPNVGDLTLTETSWKHFGQTMLVRDPQAEISATTAAEQASPPSAASSSITYSNTVSSYPLSELGYLFICAVMDLEYFPDERIKGLASFKRIHISDCPALKYLSPWIQYLTFLEELNIYNCEELEGIKWPETPTLTRLRVLTLQRLPKLKDVFAPDIQCLTSLEELLILGCDGLEEIKLTPALPRQRVLRLKSLPKLKSVFAQDIQCLTSLEKLEIDRCKGLEEIKLTPALPRLRVLTLERLPKLKDVFAQDIECLTSLEELLIHECEGLEEIKLTPVLPRLRVLTLERLPKLKDVFAPDIQCLTSLEELEIANCEGLEEIKLTPALSRLRVLTLERLPKLKHLSGVQQHLTSLEKLVINNCEELQVSNDDSIEWQALTTLRFLYLCWLPQLVSLPGGLQFLTTLKQLRILYCRNFTALPDWICKLSSLETLDIWACPKFKSVPASISSLTSLQNLRIDGKDMNPREIHEDLDLSCSASGAGKILNKFRGLQPCNK